MPWWDDVNANGVARVASQCGLQSMHNRSWGPCPACHEEKRSSADKRGPIGLRNDDAGWVCHRCKASGSPVKLITLKLKGNRNLTREDWSDIRGWCVDRNLCDSGYGGYSGRRFEAEKVDPIIKLLSSPKKVEDTIIRAEVSGVSEFWSRCLRLDRDADCMKWLESRSIDADLVSSSNLARSLPKHISSEWSKIRGGGWYDYGYKLILPMYGYDGEIVAVRARRVIEASDGLPKSSAMLGVTVRGAVMASFNAVSMLGGENAISRVVIAEGEPDFLTLASNPEWIGDINSPAVIGIVSGSWDGTMAKRIPDGATVVIATHNDPAGDKYADMISSSLAVRASYGKVKLRRLVFDAGHQ